MAKIEWRLQKMKIDDLMAHPQNPRSFTDKGMKDLETSIGRFGLAQPININTDGTIISGHARVHKLKEMGVEEIDVYIPSRTLTSSQVDELMIRMNQNQGGEWNYGMLEQFYSVPDLMEWGFSETDLPYLDAGIAEGAEEVEDFHESSNNYKIMVECDSEMQQEEVYHRLCDQGVKCRMMK